MKKNELQEVLVKNHTEFTEFIRGLSDVVARNSLPGKWTAVQQLDHIVKSVAPVRTAFVLPKFLFPLIFGRANRPSRSYDELVTKYKEKLQAGGKSTARFLPDSTCDRFAIIQALENRVNSLSSRIERFSESELDEFILPHPLLGKLTLREMLYFTIYHVEHHHLQVNLNMARAMATVN